ncbi:hypothetical protein M1M25_gp100 [Tenacibaculum phage Gundel_1]|uniref:Uncharacterized protein n=1 Tax=Tenacibaculum phage Gundel_1 TaxID=2745672 RepID=A0A8E4ZL16_9CAUD|nr:hypothetical protein M1M25_gp100 [Tenacibaculum phage Gundel_1]QQV91441.1 hypothetical protein Gundel1_118 [Tenacibaculum phage Gundel_1]
MGLEKDNFIKKIKEYSNNELWDKYNEVVIPDDYDGDYTEEGSWELEQTLKEIEYRLRDVGFLK